MTENTKHWFFQDAELSEKTFKTRTFKEKLRVIRFYALIGVLGGFLILILRYISNRVSERQQLKNKIKHFKPTIHEGVFLTTMSWELRDKPLSEQELNELT